VEVDFYVLYPLEKAETLRQADLFREVEKARKLAEAKAAQRAARQEAKILKEKAVVRPIQSGKEKLGWN
jgi:hypothetical protein